MRAPRTDEVCVCKSEKEKCTRLPCHIAPGHSDIEKPNAPTWSAGPASLPQTPQIVADDQKGDIADIWISGQQLRDGRTVPDDGLDMQIYTVGSERLSCYGLAVSCSRADLRKNVNALDSSADRIRHGPLRTCWR